VTHLGDRITPLVDGQLAPDATERAHVHLASCDPCREAVEMERLMKARLAALGTPEPGEDLVLRLLQLAGPEGPLPPRQGHVPGMPRARQLSGPGRPPRQASAPTTRPVARGVVDRPAGRGVVTAVVRRPDGRPGRLSRVSRARLTAAMVGALCLVGAGVAGGVVSEGGTSPPPAVVPPVDSFVVEHSVTTNTLTFSDQTAEWGSAGDAR
jgi:anti-sigma factor RsiW